MESRRRAGETDRESRGELFSEESGEAREDDDLREEGVEEGADCGTLDGRGLL